MPDLVILAELARVLPALADEELAQLEANLVEDGRVIDPILFFPLDGDQVILDGMNRYPIAEKHGLPFKTELHPGIKTLDDAELWVLNHQLGRRNLLKPAALRKVRGELYNRLKRDDGGHGIANLQTSVSESPTPGGQIVTPEKTLRKTAAEQVAEQSGVDERTIKRDGKYAAALGKLPDVLAKAIETGAIKATEAAVIKLASCDRNTQNDVGRDVRVGKEPTIQAALQTRGILKKAEPKADKPDAKPTKANGKPDKQFDRSAYLKQWEQAIGPLVRLVDKIARELVESKCESHKTVQEHLNIATEEMMEWMKSKVKK